MNTGRLYYRLSFLGLCLLLTACFSIFQSAPINLLYAKTVVNEDGSGNNTFQLVVPKSDCDLVPLRPELQKLKEQNNNQFHFTHYDNGRYKGFEITYEFENPQQIPEQLESIKRSVVQAIPTPNPDPDVYGAYNPDQLSIRVAPPIETLAGVGKEWMASIKINPMLLTSRGNCGIPKIVYELVLPGKINAFKVEAKSFEAESLKYTHVSQEKPNVIQWTLEPHYMADIILNLSGSEFSKQLDAKNIEGTDQLGQLLKEKINQLNETENGRNELRKMSDGKEVLADKIGDYIFDGQVYTLTVTSATPDPMFQVAIHVISPIVVLLGSIIAVITAIIKIKQSLSKKREQSQE